MRRRATAKSTSLLARPLINVESHHVDETTFCSVLPLEIGEISIPRIPVKGSRFAIAHQGVFSCRGPGARLDFDATKRSSKYGLTKDP